MAKAFVAIQQWFKLFMLKKAVNYQINQSYISVTCQLLLGRHFEVCICTGKQQPRASMASTWWKLLFAFKTLLNSCNWAVQPFSSIFCGAVQRCKFRMGRFFSPGEISQQPALRNIPAEFDICRIHLEGSHEPVFASSTGLFGIL